MFSLSWLFYLEVDHYKMQCSITCPFYSLWANVILWRIECEFHLGIVVVLHVVFSPYTFVFTSTATFQSMLYISDHVWLLGSC